MGLWLWGPYWVRFGALRRRSGELAAWRSSLAREPLVNHWLSECPLENIQGHTRLLRSTIIDSLQFVFLWLLLLTPPGLPPTLGLILLSMT